MQITETTLDLLELCRKNPLVGVSIRALAQRTGKAYPLVHAHVSRLLAEGMLVSETVGRSHCCRPNLSHPATQHLLGFLAERSSGTKLAARLREINEEMPLFTAARLRDGSVVLVTDNKAHQKRLRGLLPFKDVRILDAERFRSLLREEGAGQGVPEPLLHPALFYEQLGELARRWNA